MATGKCKIQGCKNGKGKVVAAFFG